MMSEGIKPPIRVFPEGMWLKTILSVDEDEIVKPGFGRPTVIMRLVIREIEVENQNNGVAYIYFGDCGRDSINWRTDMIAFFKRLDSDRWERFIESNDRTPEEWWACWTQICGTKISVRFGPPVSESEQQAIEDVRPWKEESNV